MDKTSEKECPNKGGAEKPARLMSIDALRGFDMFFIFLPDLQYFQNVQQIIQGISAVPKLMLLPETCGHRKEQDFIHIHASCRDKAGVSG